MVRPKSLSKRASLAAPKQSSSPTPILGKRKLLDQDNIKSVGSRKSNENGTTPKTDDVPTKRLRKSTMPYQAPESITSILKSVIPSKILEAESKAKGQAKKSATPAIKKPIPKRLSKGRIKEAVLNSKPSSSKKTKLSTPKSKTKKVTKNVQKQSVKAGSSSKKLKKKSATQAVDATPDNTPVGNGIGKKKKLKKEKFGKKGIQKDEPETSDATASNKTVKKRKSKKETLNPKPQVTLYENNPLFYSNLPIPHVSTLAHSRLVIRAVLRNDLKLLKQLITKDASLINSLCTYHSPSNNIDAITYAIQQSNQEAIKILMEVDKKAVEKFGSPPDLMLESESTGRGSYRMFGHGLRAVSVARGGLEGNQAFLRDSSEYNIPQLPTHLSFGSRNCPLKLSVELGFSKEQIEKFAWTMPKERQSNMWEELMRNFHVAVRAGNNQLAGYLLSIVTGYGYNKLHEEVLSFTTEQLTPFKAVSVVKNPYGKPKLTPVHCAAINPNPYYLQTLLNSQPAFTILDSDNWTPMHYAAVCTGDGPLKLLLSKGISTVGINKEGDTPLHLAISRGRLNNVKLILEAEKAYVNPEDPSTFQNTSLPKINRKGMKPLHLAAEKGHVGIVKALLDAGVDGNQTLGAQHEKLTPLMVACQYGHLGVVKLLVEHDVKLEMGDKRGKTAISHAVINGHAHIVSYLLRLGVNHETADSSGNTLAHYAAAYGWYFNIKLLEEAGCNMQAGNLWKLTPMSIAFMKGHIGIVEMLAKIPGVDIDSPIDAEDQSLLLYTCSTTTLNHSVIPRLQFLVDEHKADCKKINVEGNTCLHLLANKIFQSKFYHTDPRCEKEINTKKQNCLEAIKFIIEKGCDINALNEKKQTPLDIAMSTSNIWLAEKLLKLGSKLNVEVGTDGNTFLHFVSLFCTNAKPPYPQSLCETIAKNPEGLEILKSMAKTYNKPGYTPLLHVLNSTKTVESDNFKQVVNFIEYLVHKLDSDVNARVKVEDGKEENSSSVLHLLVSTSYATAILPKILSKKPDLDPLNEDLKSPLASAILKGTSGIKIAKALIKAGADVNFKSKKDWSIGLLLLLGEKQPTLFEIIPDLVSKGANVKEVNPKMKNSILHYVARNPTNPCSLEAVKTIIAAGADVNLVNTDGRTPLHLVVNSRGRETDVSYDIEDTLMSAGANLTIKDIRGRIPLHYAFVKIGKPLDTSFMDPIELVMILGNATKETSSKKALMTTDEFGATPLHYAAKRGSTICCSYLMSEMDGNIDIPDNKGNTPFGLTVWSGHEGCSLHFQQHGCDFLKILDTNIQLEDQKKDKEESSSRMNHWKWKHNQLVEEVSNKSNRAAKKFPIFQEVVHKDWQGILYLMLEKLKSLGAGISSGVSAAIKTNRLTLALKLIHRANSTRELEQIGENLIHTLAKNSGSWDLQKAVLTSLIAKGVKPLQLDDDITNPIIYSAINHNYDLIMELTTINGVDYLTKLPPDSFQRTPFSALFWNIEKYDQISVPLAAWAISLFNNGASPNILSHYPFALSKFPGIRYLTTYGSDIKNGTKFSPLIVSVIHGKFDIVKSLHQKLNPKNQSSLKTSFVDSEGRTALMHAVRLNDLKMVKLLLNPGSYDQAKDLSPWTTSYSSWKGGKAIYSEINARDKKGWNAADYAVCPALEPTYYVYANVEQILTILYKAGASFTAKSGDLSPLERAIYHKRHHIVNIMYNLMKIPEKQRTVCPPYYENFSPVTNIPGLPSPVSNFAEEAKKLTEEKALDEERPKAVPDPLLGLEKDNSEVVMDQEQDIPFDCIMTMVDISYGMYGLYNFYKMQVVKQPKGKELIFLFTQWGRVGDTGQYQKTPYASVEEAIKEFKKIFRAKSGNSWEDVKNFKIIPKKYRFVNKELANVKKSHEIKVDFDKLTKAAQTHRSVLTPEVYEVIKQMSLAHKNCSSKFQNPENLPIIATDSLIKGEAILTKVRSILDAIEKFGWGKLTDVQEEKKAAYVEELITLSEEFYTLIPVYGFAREKLQPIFDFHNLRDRQEAIYNLIKLGFGKELLLAAEYNSDSNNPFEYIYRSLGTKLKLLDLSNDFENEEAQIILQYIQNTSEEKVKVQGIYRVERAGEPEMTVENRWLLWHGSKAENLLSILHDGLQISPLGISLSGNLFGKGIYFADMFTKAKKYSSGNKSKFILLCEVALGKVSDVTLEAATQQASKSGDFLPQGYDSLKTSDSEFEPDPGTSIIWKGRTVPMGKIVSKYYKDDYAWGLCYNEYIVFNPDQVKIRYMVQFTDED